MAKLFSPLNVIGESSSPVSGALARTRNAIRRNKWRLRPLKNFVLPIRNSKRQVLTLLRTITPGLESPPAIARSTLNYIDNHSLHTALELHPSETVPPVSHPFPNTNGRDWTSSSAPARVFELKDIDFWGRYGGSIVTADNKLLADLSPEVWGVENHPIFSQLRLPLREHLAGRTAIAVTPEAYGNYYHWLIDLLPRLLLLRETHGGFDSFAQILVNGVRARYEDESLAVLGIPREKLLYVDARHRFQIESSLVPSMDHSCPVIAPWKVRALRELRDTLPGIGGSHPKRIYVSRQKAAIRRILNEERLSGLLEEAAFAVVELESLSWKEQVQLFSRAESILAPHGAALANIVFCKPDTLVMEISTRAGYKDFYRRLAASARLRYRVLEARPRVAANGSNHRALENEDMTVNEEAWRGFLRDL